MLAARLVHIGWRPTGLLILFCATGGNGLSPLRQRRLEEFGRPRLPHKQEITSSNLVLATNTSDVVSGDHSLVASTNCSIRVTGILVREDVGAFNDR